MLRVPKAFVDDTLWPEFAELDQVLRDTLERATDQVLGQVFEQDTSEAEVKEDQRLVGPMGGSTDDA
jgi:hypothetical protein